MSLSNFAIPLRGILLRRYSAPRRFGALSTSVAGIASLLAAQAQAQDPAPAPQPAPAAAPATEVAPAPAPAAEIKLAAAEPAPAPTTPTEAMPSTATEPKKLPPIGVAAWLRSDVTFQNHENPKKLDDQKFNPYGELHAGGKIHENVSVVFNINAGGVGGGVAIEDAIIGFDLQDEFHVWVGQLLVPVDRANYGGPFFAIPWNYTGAIGFVPHEGPSGRNAGVSVWGDLQGGKFKYVLGAFDGGGDDESMLFSGRLQYDFIGTEPGYFGNASYFGEKDIVALGLGAQYQGDGESSPAGVVPPATDDYVEVNADLLAEMKLANGGWVTGEGGLYITGGDYPGYGKTAFYLTGAYATPKVGIGNIQPMLRFQMGIGDDDNKVWSVDAAVSYLIMGPALRLVGNFQHVKTDPGGEENSLTFGAQAIFF